MAAMAKHTIPRRIPNNVSFSFSLRVFQVRLMPLNDLYYIQSVVSLSHKRATFIWRDRDNLDVWWPTQAWLILYRKKICLVLYGKVM